MIRLVLAMAVATSALLGIARAAVITAAITSLGGGDYQAELTLTNNSLGKPIEEFTIYFDVGKYENLSIISSVAGWDGIAVQPDPGIPDDGFADWAALSAPLDVGQMLAGFIVQFSYVGAGAPGGWFFEVIDPATFVALESGSVSTVPIPTAFCLYATALALGWIRKLVKQS